MPVQAKQRGAAVPAHLYGRGDVAENGMLEQMKGLTVGGASGTAAAMGAHEDSSEHALPDANGNHVPTEGDTLRADVGYCLSLS